MYLCITFKLFSYYKKKKNTKNPQADWTFTTMTIMYLGQNSG